MKRRKERSEPEPQSLGRDCADPTPSGAQNSGRAARATKRRDFRNRQESGKPPALYLFTRMIKRLRSLLRLGLPNLCPASALRRSNFVASSLAHRMHSCRCHPPPCLCPSRLLCERNFPTRRFGERPFRPLRFRSDTGTNPPDEVPNDLDNLIQPISLLLQLLQHPGEIRHGIPPHGVWNNCAVHTTRQAVLGLFTPSPSTAAVFTALEGACMSDEFQV